MLDHEPEWLPRARKIAQLVLGGLLTYFLLAATFQVLSNL